MFWRGFSPGSSWCMMSGAFPVPDSLAGGGKIAGSLPPALDNQSDSSRLTVGSRQGLDGLGRLLWSQPPHRYLGPHVLGGRALALREAASFISRLSPMPWPRVCV